MKIGVITYWQSSDNYGQQLQCWALQQQLKELGYEPYLIRYDANYVATRKKSGREKLMMIIKVKPLIDYLRNKRSNATNNRLKALNAELNKQRKFEEFRNKNLAVSSRIYKGLKDLQADPPEADFYVTGSDQVWANLLDKTESETYYLNFGDDKVKRVAYAPSFSLPSYPVELQGKLKEQLSHFTAVSVREETGQRICAEIGVQATTVLDPTLLLPQSLYLSLIENRSAQHPFLYVYHLNVLDAKELGWPALKTYCSKNHWDVKATNASGYMPGCELLEGAKYEYSTIQQWLGNIKQAECVVTPSFHGVVFSLIFHTRVIFIPLEGKRGRGNNRVIDLFKKLGLLSLVYENGKSFDEYMQVPIDWEDVDARLKQLRLQSLAFIEQAFEK